MKQPKEYIAKLLWIQILPPTNNRWHNTTRAETEYTPKGIVGFYEILYILYLMCVFLVLGCNGQSI